MKFKNLFSAIGFTAISLFATAQTTITNGGFETWTGSGSTIEPTQWNSTKSMAGLPIAVSAAPQTCWQEASNPHSGSYCARVKTGSAIGNVVNGALTTGRVTAPSTNKAEGYIISNSATSDYAMPFTGRPDSLVFWIKYQPSGNDYATVEARLHVGDCHTPEAPVNGNHPNTTANIIARAQYNSTNVTIGSWTRISVPFVYEDNRTPAYILIAATSSGSQTNGVANSEMWLDDFEAIYNPTITLEAINPLVYNVSAVAGAPITVPFTLTGNYNGANTVTAQLSDASGSFASPVTLGTTTTTTSGSIAGTIPAGTASGTGYKVRVITSAPSLTSNESSAITINLAASVNSIAPTTQQNLEPGQNGAQLTVTESPAGSSREWKYSTTSGSGYVSFSSPETGLTYTPNFAAAGTYYVVCVSQIGASSLTSNEVTVVVTPNYTLSTNNVSGSPFLISASANATTTVSFTSNAVFNPGNVFTVEISDELGGFSIPNPIQTLSATTIQPITVQIPNNLSAGNQYKIRVKSSDPAIVGTPSPNTLEVIPFTVSVSPTEAQTIIEGQDGSSITVTESHLSTREWKWRNNLSYNSFDPAQTAVNYTPNFSVENTYHVRCFSTNDAGDVVESEEVMIVVQKSTGIKGVEQIAAQIYQSGDQLVIKTEEAYDFSLFSVEGQLVLNANILSGRTTLDIAHIAKGTYAFRLGNAGGRIVIQ